MRFLLDENADYQLATFVRLLGHDITTILDDYPRSLADQDILAIAVAEDRVVITNDKDFGELVFWRKLPHRGIILFRLDDESLDAKKAWLQKVLTDFADQLDQFIVVTERGVRVRRVRKP